MRKKWLDNKEKKIAAGLVLVFVLCLIPVLILARYNYPCADDFGFSAYSHIAWQNTHSVIQVLRGACETVKERWTGWQGTFSSIFLMALQPAVFGDPAYSLVPWIMIGLMSASTLFLFYVVIVKCTGGSRAVWLSISMMYLIFALECMIDKTQGFFWFNGAAHYMAPHSVAYFLLGELILLLKEPKYRARRLVFGCAAALFVGGSNYITALIAAVLFVTALGVLVFGKRKREACLLLAPFILFMIAFLLNVLAPGNSVRQDEILTRPGVLRSIILSFYYCAAFMTDSWLNWTYVIYVLALLPFLWELVRAAGDKFRYPYPLLVPVYSFCILSAMFTPSLFATFEPGGGRIYNIMFLDFLAVIAFNLFYLMGWFNRRSKKAVLPKESFLEKKEVRIYLTAVACFAVLIAVLYTKMEPDYFTTTSALRSLASGEAAAYGEEASRRTEKLKAAQGEPEVTLKLFQTRPYLLFFDDIGIEAENWQNRSMARYYEKEAVTGVNRPEGAERDG